MGFHLFSELRPALIGKMTQRAVLEALRDRGPMSRAGLTRTTGISPTTVSNAVGALLKARLLEEGPPNGPPALGRPGKLLRLAADGSQVIGAVLDGHQCQIVAAGVDGRLKDPVTFATPDTYAGILDALAAHARGLMSRGVRTLGLGLSLPGLIHQGEGRAVFSTNLHQTDGRAPARDMKERLRLRTTILHDTDALCLAERAYGAARGIEDYAVVDCIEGFGLGVVIKGQVLQGCVGFAGELGHVAFDAANGHPCGCGKRGCLDTVATDAALARHLSERLGRTVTIDDALAQVREGQPEAIDEARRALDGLSIGLAAVINTFNPAAVFVHSRLLDCDAGLLDSLLALTRTRALAPAVDHCRVMRARASKIQGVIAGFIDYLFDIHGPRLRAAASDS